MARRKKFDFRGSSHGEEQSRKTVEREVESEFAESEAVKTTVADPGEVTVRGDKMEQGKDAFEGFSELTRNFLSLDTAKKVAALCIETGEQLAEGALEFQAKSTAWAKDSPLASLFEAQNSMGRKLVELSADAARRLWRIEDRHTI